MSIVVLDALERLPPSRLKALLARFAEIEDPREPWRVAHPLPEVLFLAVWGSICDCDDYEAISAWETAHLAFLRQYLPYHHGVPGGRWLTLLMNRINPALFSAAFTAWVCETWPARPALVAIDGKTSRRSHDRSTSQATAGPTTRHELGPAGVAMRIAPAQISASCSCKSVPRDRTGRDQTRRCVDQR